MLPVQIPSSRVSIEDTRTGYIERTWYLFLDNLAKLAMMIPARIGMRKSTTTAVGALTATWVTVVDYTSAVFAVPRGGNFNMTDGLIRLLDAGDYVATVNLDIECDPDILITRTILYRIFNTTDSVVVPNSNGAIYVINHSSGVSVSLTIPFVATPSTDASPIVGKSLCVQISTGDTFTGVNIMGATFAMTSVDNVVEAS